MEVVIHSLQQTIRGWLNQINPLWFDAVKTFLVQVGSQLIRLVSNLLFTYLLLPEYFGIMALVNVLVTGVQLLTDFGFNPAIQRSHHYSEKEFQLTAWSMQWIRGIILCFLSCAMASSIANFYRVADIEVLLMITSISLLLNGFCNIEIILLPRKGMYYKASLIDLKSQSIAIGIIVISFLFFNSIIQLALIPVLYSLIRCLYAHKLSDRHQYKIHFKKKYCYELLGYGSVIFLSSSLSFIAQQYDKINLGTLLTMQTLGVFSIAVSLAEAPRLLMSQMSSKFFIPLYSRYRDISSEKLNALILKKRFVPLFVFSLFIAVVIVFSDELISNCYASQYRDVGWMFSILVLGSWPIILCISYDSILYTHTKPWCPVFGQIMRFVHLLFIPLIYTHYGMMLTVVWIASRDIWYWMVIQIGLKKMGHQYWKQDIKLSLCFVVILYLLLKFKASFII